MNPVEKRIWELASFEKGKRKLIRRVHRKEIVHDQRYAWLLFGREQDPEPVDTVVLDVTLAEAQAIDSQIRENIAPTN